MYRLSKIPEEYRPEIISDISDDKLYTFIVRDWKFNKFKRKDASPIQFYPCAAQAVLLLRVAQVATNYAVDIAWEGSYSNPSKAFKNIIDKNIPCALMHKVKNKWASAIDTVVCFMTGDTRDVFLVRPDDLTEWDPNEEINDV